MVRAMADASTIMASSRVRMDGSDDDTEGTGAAPKASAVSAPAPRATASAPVPKAAATR